LTASLWHGIGRRDRQARSLPQWTPRSPLEIRSIFVAVFVAVLAWARPFRHREEAALAGWVHYSESTSTLLSPSRNE
jgi:hypothetical protein